MKSRILGAVGAILGGTIMLSGLLNSNPESSGAYAQGQIAGFVFGIILFGAGLYYLIKDRKHSSPGK